MEVTDYVGSKQNRDIAYPAVSKVGTNIFRTETICFCYLLTPFVLWNKVGCYD